MVEVPECSLGDCGISCQFGCSCIQAGAGCECSCENITLPAFTSSDAFRLRLKGVKKADPELLVDFTGSDMSLFSLAEWFEWLFPGQIMLPASKTRATFSTDGIVRQIKLGDLVEHVGLVRNATPLVGREFSDEEPEAGSTTGCCGS